MEFRRVVLVAGWSGEPPRLGGVRFTPVTVAGIWAAVVRAREGAVLVLGDEALRRLPPASLPKSVHPPRCFVLGVGRRVPVEVLLAWDGSGAAEILSEAWLPSRVSELVRLPVRLQVPDSAFVPARGRGGHEILRHLRLLPSPRPGLLAQALGMERHRLAEECWRKFGMTPRTLCRRYELAVLAKERKAGRAVHEVAASLQIAAPGSLWRACRREGVRMPPRGG